MRYDFKDQLQFSKGRRCNTDISTISAILTGCVSVEPAPAHLDKQGVDYIATLRRGATVYVDAKTRARGCSRYWQTGRPELAIEIWSVMPGGKYETPYSRAKVGWTLDESKITDMVMYTWDESDCTVAYLLSFQTLRMAAANHVATWRRQYKVDIQDSHEWESQAVFVPADVVQDAMRQAQEFEIAGLLLDVGY